jgi:hypothetical protein
MHYTIQVSLSRFWQRETNMQIVLYRFLQSWQLSIGEWLTMYTLTSENYMYINDFFSNQQTKVLCQQATK